MRYINSNDAKKIFINAILSGTAVMIVVFAISLLLPKTWLVSGKIVIFPSGHPVSASGNLLPEVGNTAWMINSDTFQMRTFGEARTDFAGASVIKNSSMVLVQFRSREENIESFEDLIVKIPSQVDEYARDIYEGTPFKYKLVADPEISARPVDPDLAKNSYWGFAAGILVYLLYWLFFEFLHIPSEKNEEYEIQTEDDELGNSVSSESAKDVLPKPASIGGGTIELIDGRPKFKPGKVEKEATGVPENLPVAGLDAPPTPQSEEPTDDEVKERLNRLMRGEL